MATILFQQYTPTHTVQYNPGCNIFTGDPFAERAQWPNVLAELSQRGGACAIMPKFNAWNHTPCYRETATMHLIRSVQMFNQYKDPVLAKLGFKCMQRGSKKDILRALEKAGHEQIAKKVKNKKRADIMATWRQW